MKKQLSVILIASLVSLASGSRVFAQGSAKKAQPSPVEKIKAKIAKLGAGKKARAQIKLQTGEKIKGYVSSAGENDFAFTEKSSGLAKTISYADVAEVKKSGGLSTAATASYCLPSTSRALSSALSRLLSRSTLG